MFTAKDIRTKRALQPAESVGIKDLLSFDEGSIPENQGDIPAMSGFGTENDEVPLTADSPKVPESGGQGMLTGIDPVAEALQLPVDGADVANENPVAEALQLPVDGADVANENGSVAYDVDGETPVRSTHNINERERSTIGDDSEGTNHVEAMHADDPTDDEIGMNPVETTQVDDDDAQEQIDNNVPSWPTNAIPDHLIDPQLRSSLPSPTQTPATTTSRTTRQRKKGTAETETEEISGRRIRKKAGNKEIVPLTERRVILPDWLEAAHGYLQKADDSPEWQVCIEAWLKFEEDLGYTDVSSVCISERKNL